MKIALLSLGLLAATLLFPGCGRSGSDAAIDDKTGVAPCDAYIARLTACTHALPPEARAAHGAAILMARDLLEEKADKAEAETDRVALADACTQMADALSGRPGCD
jgi:hypothetical protein